MVQSGAMKTLDDKLKDQAKKSIKTPAAPSSTFTGFRLRLPIFQKLLKRLGLPAIKASKSYTILRKKEILTQCFDRQDLHLLRYYEINSSKKALKRKIWNIRLPKHIPFSNSNFSAPVTHRKVVNNLDSAM